ncbi:hypothetical protein RHGRI_012949 [Rhododendron griersonianum]|uniref:Uncharacterized protein n=1 Tax=Rhododendron griersonianum TaxID=479676 RepID=A0AAV6K3Q8_9ERIC|nr:hypothetical protein RHGRI_012949 [Rhododendron griersonianum]
MFLCGVPYFGFFGRHRMVDLVVEFSFKGPSTIFAMPFEVVKMKELLVTQPTFIDEGCDLRVRRQTRKSWHFHSTVQIVTVPPTRPSTSCITAVAAVHSITLLRSSPFQHHGASSPFQHP